MAILENLLDTFFLKSLKGIRQYQHFSLRSDEPGVIPLKKSSSGVETKINILRVPNHRFTCIKRPDVVRPSGLSESRKQYLFTNPFSKRPVHILLITGDWLRIASRMLAELQNETFTLSLLPLTRQCVDIFLNGRHIRPAKAMVEPAIPAANLHQMSGTICYPVKILRRLFNDGERIGRKKVNKTR
ncbi:hypothetical protein KUTeg_009139 [Tegillarca granosa]|uniref:Uncharacterized protein n=1 Tax=Tegillarca granosa TaxID=220873 RepID=A0ABQ9F7N0_TEGGR|nr:hypothetical protein KUTeg_009139 [Tegillarca granosa]